jgi:hypothetical protein
VLADAIFVYLSPKLEQESQAQVDFTVAHEFAHVILKHYDYRVRQTVTDEQAKELRSHQEFPDEKAADKLATTWGFRREKEKK